MKEAIRAPKPFRIGGETQPKPTRLARTQRSALRNILEEVSAKTRTNKINSRRGLFDKELWDKLEEQRLEQTDQARYDVLQRSLRESVGLPIENRK